MNKFKRNLTAAQSIGIGVTSKKVTIKERRIFMKEKLASQKVWALKALMKIYDNQTSDEQEHESTHYHNDIGFTGADAEILSSFAKFYKRTGFLTTKQMVYVYKKIPKYWAQLVKISDMEQLDGMVKLQRVG